MNPCAKFGPDQRTHRAAYNEHAHTTDFIYTVSQKNVTTSFKMCSTRIVHLQQFLAHLLPRV